METRGRAYRRYRRHLAIVHKKGLSRRLIGEDWFRWTESTARAI